MVVPVARGLATRTTIWTEPVAPAARLPTDQVTTPEARVPAGVAETKVVLAGTESLFSKAAAPAEMFFLYVIVSVPFPPAATGSGESVLETASSGAELTVVETAA